MSERLNHSGVFLSPEIQRSYDPVLDYVRGAPLYADELAHYGFMIPDIPHVVDEVKVTVFGQKKKLLTAALDPKRYL